MKYIIALPGGAFIAGLVMVAINYGSVATVVDIVAGM